ncbi:MAG: maleylpyruvate isomerase family mycothiol-dependent enzyme [Acidimicrobiales bacterium]
MNEAAMWSLIHAERARLAQTLSTLTPEQWAHSTLCGEWNVQLTTAHVVAGAEQTTGNFVRRFAASAFRFDVMTSQDAQRIGTSAPELLIKRLLATVTTTNHPPAPITAMLTEIVAHQEDICQPLDINSGVTDEALVATLEFCANAGFPLGSRKRVAGLALGASDLKWTHGSGPKVEGPGKLLMLAMLGRRPALTNLSGDGVAELTSRLG